jgi:hypothetical protein
MHMARLPRLKPDLKYGFFSVGKTVTENVIIAEVPARLHIILRITIAFVLLYDEYVTASFKNQTRYLFLNSVHFRLLFKSLARKGGIIGVEETISMCS